MDVEDQQCVEFRGREIHTGAPHADLVAMAEAGVTVRFDQTEARIENQKFRVRGNQDAFAAKGDPSQTAVSPATLEIDVGPAPIELWLRGSGVKVHQVEAAMALADLRAAHHRGGEHARQPRRVCGHRPGRRQLQAGE